MLPRTETAKDNKESLGGSFKLSWCCWVSYFYDHLITWKADYPTPYPSPHVLQWLKYLSLSISKGGGEHFSGLSLDKLLWTQKVNLNV